VVQEATTVVADPQTQPPPPDVEPQPLPSRPLPTTLWEEHLFPLLTYKDAARLGGTCKALRVVVREYFKDLGPVSMKTANLDTLEAALTSFPEARTVTAELSRDKVDVRGMVQWLRVGGRGRYLERVTLRRSAGGPSTEAVLKALQHGALPSLKSAAALLRYPSQRASLTEGHVAAMHELQLSISLQSDDGDQEQLAALGLARQLPSLSRLEVYIRGYSHVPVQWPPFVPPTLKTLRIDVMCESRQIVEPFLCALPGMLEHSGARLDRLEVLLPCDLSYLGDGLVHLAQALRCFSLTLKTLLLDMNNRCDLRGFPCNMQWADVMAAVSTCRELQVLVLPRIEGEPLFPPGTAFARLTHLEMTDFKREHPPGAGVMGLWELMASGGLPALAKLSVRPNGGWGDVEKVRSRVVPALEAVAGTLTHLQLDKVNWNAWGEDGMDVAYELGVAVGKLRRLKDLALDLSLDGRIYYAFAQGLAASGGDRGDPPLPLLWRITVPQMLRMNNDLLTSLLLPSVRVFVSSHADRYVTLLMACALHQAGYKHTWQAHYYSPACLKDLRAIASCRVVYDDFPHARVPWTAPVDDGVFGREWMSSEEGDD
jgi:hypothetical protein